MKTVVYFQNVPEDSFWIVVDGDLRKFDEQYINSIKDYSLENKMMKTFFDSFGQFRFNQAKITREEAEKQIREGAYLIACGFHL